MKTAGARRADVRAADFAGSTIWMRPDAEIGSRLCGAQHGADRARRPLRLHLDELAERLKAAGRSSATPACCGSTLEDGITLVLFPDGRVLVQGTDDPDLARRVDTASLALSLLLSIGGIADTMKISEIFNFRDSRKVMLCRSTLLI